MSQENVKIFKRGVEAAHVSSLTRRSPHSDARDGTEGNSAPRPSADKMSEDAKFALGF